MIFRWPLESSSPVMTKQDSSLELSRRKLGMRTLIVRTTKDANLIWALRKAGLSLLTGRKGDAKPVTHAELVEKLVLTGTSAGGPTHVAPSPEMLALLMQNRTGVEIGELSRRSYSQLMAPGFAESHPDDMERVAENARYRPQSPEAYMRQLQTAMSHNVSDRLEQIRVPTLVMHGEVDPLVPVENGRYLAEHIHGAQLICYPNTGHISIVERADDYNRDVLAFLAA